MFFVVAKPFQQSSLQRCWNIQSNQSLFLKLDQDLDQCQYFEVVCVKQPCMSSDVQQFFVVIAFGGG